MQQNPFSSKPKIQLRFPASATTILGSKPVPVQFKLPEDVVGRITDYAGLLKVPVEKLLTRFTRALLHYTLDTHVAISASQENTAFLVSGERSRASGTPKPFGFEHFQIGVVYKEDAKSGHAAKRITVYGFHPIIPHVLGGDKFMKFAELFFKRALETNHDILHSIAGEPLLFKNNDMHLRYGGVEFSPVILQAQLHKSKLDKIPGFKEQVAAECSAYLDIVKNMSHADPEVAEQLKKLKLHSTAILLRRLLMGLPYDHEIVTGFLAKAQEEVFEGEKVVIQPRKWLEFLHRDFSDGNHPDKYGTNYAGQTNRTRPYLHGSKSFMRPWFNKLFKSYFGEKMDQPTTQDLSTLILLETLRGGHGIFGVVSAYKHAAIKPDLKMIYDPFRNF